MNIHTAVVSALTTVTLASPAAPPACDSPSASQLGGTGSASCEQGWVCGTCPDGTSWGYLNDPKYTNDPRLSTLFFDNRRPCG
jgi:hypothetical protein